MEQQPIEGAVLDAGVDAYFLASVEAGTETMADIREMVAAILAAGFSARSSRPKAPAPTP